MGSAPVNDRLAMLVEVFVKLIGPILVLLTGLCLVIYTHVLHPPPDAVTTATGGSMVALALGRGFDKIDKFKGRG